MRYSIDSILNQTFTDFELIIADNASTDSTQEICEEYAMKDARVHYYRNDQNMGAPWNFNHTYQLSRAVESCSRLFSPLTARLQLH